MNFGFQSLSEKSSKVSFGGNSYTISDHGGKTMLRSNIKAGNAVTRLLSGNNRSRSKGAAQLVNGKLSPVNVITGLAIGGGVAMAQAKDAGTKLMAAGGAIQDAAIAGLKETGNLAAKSVDAISGFFKGQNKDAADAGAAGGDAAKDATKGNDTSAANAVDKANADMLEDRSPMEDEFISPHQMEFEDALEETASEMENELPPGVMEAMEQEAMLGAMAAMEDAMEGIDMEGDGIPTLNEDESFEQMALEMAVIGAMSNQDEMPEILMPEGWTVVDHDASESSDTVPADIMALTKQKINSIVDCIAGIFTYDPEKTSAKAADNVKKEQAQKEDAAKKLNTEREKAKKEVDEKNQSLFMEIVTKQSQHFYDTCVPNELKSALKKLTPGSVENPDEKKSPDKPKDKQTDEAKDPDATNPEDSNTDDANKKKRAACCGKKSAGCNAKKKTEDASAKEDKSVYDTVMEAAFSLTTLADTITDLACPQKAYWDTSLNSTMFDFGMGDLLKLLNKLKKLQSKAMDCISQWTDFLSSFSEDKIESHKSKLPKSSSNITRPGQIVNLKDTSALVTACQTDKLREAAERGEVQLFYEICKEPGIDLGYARELYPMLECNAEQTLFNVTDLIVLARTIGYIRPLIVAVDPNEFSTGQVIGMDIYGNVVEPDRPIYDAENIESYLDENGVCTIDFSNINYKDLALDVMRASVYNLPCVTNAKFRKIHKDKNVPFTNSKILEAEYGKSSAKYIQAMVNATRGYTNADVTVPVYDGDYAELGPLEI